MCLKVKIVSTPEDFKFLIGKEFLVLGTKVVNNTNYYILDLTKEDSIQYEHAMFPVESCVEVPGSVGFFSSLEDIGSMLGFKTPDEDDLISFRDGIVQIHELGEHDTTLPSDLPCSCGEGSIEALLIVGTAPMYLCRGCLGRVSKLVIDYLTIV